MSKPQIKWKKTRPDAVIPTKAFDSDSGFDLTLLEPIRTVAGICTFYDTGISYEMPPGYYFEMIPRSSISKTGHLFANSVGVLDESYRGSIQVAIVRFTEGKPGPLKTPIKLMQLILRKRVDDEVEFIEVDSINNTPRGSGGFGSTG